MPDWNRLREAFVAGLDNGRRLACLRAVESWLDLAVPEASIELNKASPNFGAALLYNSLVVLNFKTQREAGIDPTPGPNPALQKLITDVQDGSASDASRNCLKHLTTIWQLGGILLQADPGLAAAPSTLEAAKVQLQNEQNALFSRLEALNPNTVPGTVTAESIAQLEAILKDADALIGRTSSANPGLPSLYSMTGHTARTLGNCLAIVGRNADAIATLNKAAAYYIHAREPAEVADCKLRAQDLAKKVSGDLDAAAAISLAALSEGSAGDPLSRVKALMDLSDVGREVADTFDAREKANAAASLLESLGYADPAKCGADAGASDRAADHAADHCMDSWIATAASTTLGTPMLALVSQVGGWYIGILGARYGATVGKDDTAADALNYLKFAVQKLMSQLHTEATAAETALMSALNAYFPHVSHPAPSSQSVPPARDFQTFSEQTRVIDDALLAITKTCNERDATGAPMDDLLAQLQTLKAQADQLNSPDYEAKTRLGEAYVLDHLDRNADVIPVAQDARKRLLAGRAASLYSFSQAYGRYWYLESLNREIVALIRLGNSEAALQLAEATIRDFESGRYRINSEYRQSAILSFVADIYKWAAFAAFRLQKWDNMLQAIDLIKARSAIRSRLVPDPPKFLASQLAHQFDRLSRNSETLTAPQEETRRQLWDLLSIARSQNGHAAELPSLTVSALQRALAPDEALIGYFWLLESVVLTIAIDAGRIHVERIVLDAPKVDQLKKFVALIQKLKGTFNMDKAVAKLGDFLLPGFLRDFIKDKKRLIFSPHHSLHLFPFHAVPWDSGFVGSEFAISYVPNFSSILLPWDKKLGNRALTVAIRNFSDSSIPALTNVEDDVRAIRRFYKQSGGRVRSLLGKSATRYRIEKLRRRGRLSGLRCVHLGTHGLSVFENPNQPLESRLLLQNGSLDAMDIANLRLDAELAVLSACHSGQRAIQVRELGELPGDDIFGLQSALFKSGVRSILGTLWIVQTNSASAITREFHRHFAAGDPAEVALQKAVKQYLSDPALPRGIYFWAPFFISSLGSRPKENQPHARTYAAL